MANVWLTYIQTLNRVIENVPESFPNANTSDLVMRLFVTMMRYVLGAFRRAGGKRVIGNENSVYAYDTVQLGVATSLAFG